MSYNAHTQIFDILVQFLIGCQQQGGPSIALGITHTNI